MKADLKLLQNWFQYNSIALNSSKTKYMIITNKQNQPGDVLGLEINNESIELVHSYKY
jgi:hypothetical protein